MSRSMQNAALLLSLILALAPALHSATAQATASTPPSAAPSNPQAAALILSALASIDSKDLDGAQKQLEQAQALRPDQEFYWATYGKLMLRRGQNPEALAAYRKELAFYPREIPIYRSIVDVQFALHQRNDAEKSLHDWALGDPSDPLPAAKLVMLLVEDGDPPAAIQEANASLARLPENLRGGHRFDDDRLQVELGRAQILAGKKDAGAAAVRAVLAQSSDPGMIDNAAWVLADADLDPPAAQTATQAILVFYGAETGAWTLAQPFKSLRGQTTNVASAWETLGWLYFRQGKLDQAHSYMTAAWLVLQSPETAAHLAEIESSRGEKQAALADYELALAIKQPDDNLGERKALAPRPADLQARVAALGVPEVALTTEELGLQMEKLHTVLLGPHEGRNQRVSYRLLLKDGLVVDAQPLQANRNIEGALAMLARTDFTRYCPQGAHMQIALSGQFTCTFGSCQVLVGP